MMTAKKQNIATYFNKPLFILFMFLFPVTLTAQDDFKRANEFYSQAQYEDAIIIYEDILKNRGEATELYYNLGNAYYKTGEWAKAILNYERGLLLSPGDKDLKANLQLAQSKTTDKIVTSENFFVGFFQHKVIDLLSSNGWAWLSILFFIGTLAFIFGFVFTKKASLRQLSFFGGILLLVLSVSSFFFSKHQADKINHRNVAIIMEPAITVKSSPDISGTDLFLLHEGTKVKIRTTLSQWIEIELADGKIGWIPSDSMEII